MDELTALRQQVEALQLQNTQLMVRLTAVTVLLLATLLPLVHLYVPWSSNGPGMSVVHDEGKALTTIEQGLLSQAVPCPQNAPAEEPQAQEGPFSVGVMVLGASGDLAKKKTYPALFHLFRNKLIPHDVVILGYSRTKMTREKFQEHLGGVVKGFDDEWAAFMARCWYHGGAYDSADDMREAANQMNELHGKNAKKIDRIFYMALPPSVFIPAAKALKAGGLSSSGWNRIIVEKPFGHDLESSKVLNAELSKLFTESQLYRIDHYLGKEIVQNLMALRFANSAFEPIWNSKYIANVRITFRENFGCEGRAGYFDQSGIIRDVMQNHLLQTMALIAMDCPVTLGAEDVRNEKVKVLRAVAPLLMKDLVVGQYGTDSEGKVQPYWEESGVAEGSVTPTFATAVLHVNNSRWEGVPFILKAGKGLAERKVDIRIQFKPVGTHLFPTTAANELVFIVQPNEAIYLKMMNKVPGLTNELSQSELDLTYKSRFSTQHTPDAYERLILDVFRGDHNLFVRADELEAAWQIFTPALHTLEKEKKQPIRYTYGSRGPSEGEDLAQSYGWKRYEGYSWPAPSQKPSA